MSFLESCQEQGKDGVCPICSSGPVKEGDLLEIVIKKEGDIGEEGSTSKVVIRKNNFVSSTKIDALIRNLRKFPGLFLIPALTVRWWCRTDPRPRPPLPGGGVFTIHDLP